MARRITAAYLRKIKRKGGVSGFWAREALRAKAEGHNITLTPEIKGKAKPKVFDHRKKHPTKEDKFVARQQERGMTVLKDSKGNLTVLTQEALKKRYVQTPQGLLKKRDYTAEREQHKYNILLQESLSESKKQKAEAEKQKVAAQLGSTTRKVDYFSFTIVKPSISRNVIQPVGEVSFLGQQPTVNRELLPLGSPRRETTSTETFITPQQTKPPSSTGIFREQELQAKKGQFIASTVSATTGFLLESGERQVKTVKKVGKAFPFGVATAAYQITRPKNIKRAAQSFLPTVKKTVDYYAPNPFFTRPSSKNVASDVAIATKQNPTLVIGGAVATGIGFYGTGKLFRVFKPKKPTLTASTSQTGRETLLDFDIRKGKGAKPKKGVWVVKPESTRINFKQKTKLGLKTITEKGTIGKFPRGAKTTGIIMRDIIVTSPGRKTKVFKIVDTAPSTKGMFKTGKQTKKVKQKKGQQKFKEDSFGKPIKRAGGQETETRVTRDAFAGTEQAFKTDTVVKTSTRKGLRTKITGFIKDFAIVRTAAVQKPRRFSSVQVGLKNRPQLFYTSTPGTTATIPAEFSGVGKSEFQRTEFIIKGKEKNVLAPDIPISKLYEPDVFTTSTGKATKATQESFTSGSLRFKRESRLSFINRKIKGTALFRSRKATTTLTPTTEQVSRTQKVVVGESKPTTTIVGTKQLPGVIPKDRTVFGIVKPSKSNIKGVSKSVLKTSSKIRTRIKPRIKPKMAIKSKSLSKITPTISPVTSIKPAISTRLLRAQKQRLKLSTKQRTQQVQKQRMFQATTPIRPGFRSPGLRTPRIPPPGGLALELPSGIKRRREKRGGFGFKPLSFKGKYIPSLEGAIFKVKRVGKKRGAGSGLGLRGV